MLVLNFKAYGEATGDKAIDLANIAEEVSQDFGPQMIIAPQTADIYRTANIIDTIAQHIDPADPGSKTGSSLAETAKAAGAIGSLLNHSEKRIPEKDIKAGIEKLRSLDMISIVCSQDAAESKKLAALKPDYIAVEPPELIGSGVSVSKAKPSVITDTIESVKSVDKGVKVLCGAGVSNGEDVKKALKLGAEGILLASAFVKAENPREALEAICGGFE